MSTAPELRVWSILLSVEGGSAVRGISYEIWAHDEAQAAKLALDDVRSRGERARDALRCEIGPRLAQQAALPQVRFRASQMTHFSFHDPQRKASS